MEFFNSVWLEAVDELCLHAPKQLFTVLKQLKKAGDILPLQSLTRPLPQRSFCARDLKAWIENQIPELNSPYDWQNGCSLLSRRARANKALCIMNILITAGFKLKEDGWIVDQFRVCLKHLIRANHYPQHKRPLTPSITIRLLETSVDANIVAPYEAIGLVDSYFNYHERCLCFYSLTGWALGASENSPAQVLLAHNAYSTLANLTYRWGAMPDKAHLFAIKLEQLARYLRALSEKEGLAPTLPTSFSTPAGINDEWTKKGLREYNINVIY